jgi:Tfx family DNA-binding protein
MRQGLLTDRQKEVLRLRKEGLTQQQIADIIHTSKANVCTIEKAANENIEKAKDTLEFLYTLDATRLCTLKEGSDLLDVVNEIYEQASRVGIKVRYDSIELMNRLRSANPEQIKGRHIRSNIEVYLSEDGELYFG